MTAALRPIQPPTREEVERVREQYERWLIEYPDLLASSALVYRIPRLLARIDYLEGLLKRAVCA